MSAVSQSAVSSEPRAARGAALLIGRRLWARLSVRVVVAAACYYGAAKLGYVLEFAGPVAAIVWLPAGVGIAFLLLGGVALWPGVLAGDLLANNYSALPLGSALGQTCGNMLEVVVATVLLRRLARRGSPLDSVGGVARMVGAVAAGTAVSATIGALSLRLGGVTANKELVEVWRTWWLGDLSGALVVVPLALAWLPLRGGGLSRARAVEAGLMLAAVVLLAEIGTRSHSPLTYIVFPALIGAALRFGQRGASLAVAIAAGFAVWNTTHYVGPFSFDSITRSVLSTQLYVAVAALTTVALAAVVTEREAFAQRLGASRAQLFEVAEGERRRIERNLHDGAQQRLNSLALHLRLASEQVGKAPELVSALFAEAEEELQVAVEELRELAQGTHPALLTTFGLANAVKSLAARSAVPIRIIALPPSRVDDAAEAIAYYVIAETVTNAQKHAQATILTVEVALTADRLRIEVVDDGVGGAAETAGSGLRGLRERVEAASGSFGFISRDGEGTRITASIPAHIR